MEDEIVTHLRTHPYIHTDSSSVPYQNVCIFYLQIMFCLFLLCYHAATNGKTASHSSLWGFLAVHFFSAGVVCVCVCSCMCVVVVGGTVTVADRWPFLSLSDHVEHCLERSSEQKMDFISACITGFKVQQALCNLRALCIMLH